VLAVDDDADTLSLIRLLLPEERFEVIEARDAFEGLRAMNAHVPDVLLADALLPVMSGLELCRIVKTHPTLAGTRVVILSAAAQEEEIRSGFQVGADDYLVKPFSSQDLLERLDRLTG
jgi:DNA-binding response OmpR family regulator